MRYTQAIREKRIAYERYLEEGVVGETDCCVVAVSTAALWPFGEGVGMPRILKAVLPIGEEQFVLERETFEVVRSDFSYREELRRVSGAVVSTAAFFSPEYGIISGLIRDNAAPVGFGQHGLERFVTVNNPTGRNELPRGYFRAGTEYWVTIEGDHFSIEETDHSALR